MRYRGETDINKLLEQASERLDNITPEFIQWWSWPEVFGSTAGPGGGIGGHMMTQFQVFGFQSDYGEKPILFCAGKWRIWRNFPEQRWPR